MRGWGHSPSYSGETYCSYRCPWHDDNRPSLVVDKVVREGASDLGFKCFACGQEGYGAIQLAARLMGMPPGIVAKEELGQVLAELSTRCAVELEPEADDSGKKHFDTVRTTLVGWTEFLNTEKQYADWDGEQPIFENGAWTEEGLKALGFKLELSTRKLKKSEYTEYSEKSGYAGVRVGDLLTQFDADTGEALYRCSLGAGFYGDPKKAEVKTVSEWGKDAERLFNVRPVSRFIQRMDVKTGGFVVRIVKATKNYPIFMFPYPWGIKKYEPRDVYGNTKWTWWNVTEEADLYHQFYADSDLTDVLTPGTAIPALDERHPYVVTDKDKEGKVQKIRFCRVVLCSGPRDAMAVYSHSDAHVVWLHSEQAGFDKKGGNVRPNRWLRSFINRLQSVTVEGQLYVCYDEDAVGLSASQAICLNNPKVRWLRLPKELGMVTVGANARPLKDVTDFVQYFGEVERRMPADVQHDDPVEWFENALYDTPTCQFWQWESSRKDKDGSDRARYKFDLRNTPVFLRARGMVRKVMPNANEPFSRFFLLGNDKKYVECFAGDKGVNKLIAKVRDLMAEWLRAHKAYNDEKGALSRAIYSAKIEQGTMEAIEQVDFSDKSYGDDFDFFFFKNTAVRVTAEEIKTVSYGQMKEWTNEESIMDGDFRKIPQSWRVVVNPLYAAELEKHEQILSMSKVPEEIAQENMRWDQWSSLWHYQLKTDKPIDEMPMHFRFLYNTCRIFWEKESMGSLTPTERQMQDMYFIAMLHAIGSALVRHRSANRQQFIHITDNGTRREDLASGGTGKTAILELFGLMRRVLSIDGKSLEGGNIVLEQELGKLVPGLHNIVCLDELPAGFSPKKMYNYPLSLTSRGMYRVSVRLEGDDLPKFVVASNEQLDLSSDSTSRRVYQILVSDWYHPRSMDGSRPAHTPADDFRKEYGVKEVARNLPAPLLNEARNLLLGCVQLFLQLPDETIRPPKDHRAMLRQAIAASKDEQFTRWITDYLSDQRHLGIPIAQRELAISLCDYCGITVDKKKLTASYARIRNNLDDYIRTSVYVCNPAIVLKTDTDKANKMRQCAAWQYPKDADGGIMLDESGNRMPRELVKKKPYPRCYYFYKKDQVPKHSYSPDHEGDYDYVQAAPEVDPDAV